MSATAYKQATACLAQIELAIACNAQKLETDIQCDALIALGASLQASGMHPMKGRTGRKTICYDQFHGGALPI